MEEISSHQRAILGFVHIERHAIDATNAVGVSVVVQLSNPVGLRSEFAIDISLERSSETSFDVAIEDHHNVVHLADLNLCLHKDRAAGVISMEVG